MIKSAHLTGPVSRKAGGLFDAMLHLVQSQHQQGMKVKVFGLWDEFADVDLKLWNPVPVAVFKPSWPKMIGRSPKFIEELNTFAPDISHTHGLWLYPSIATKNYSRKKNRPYLISPHGMLDGWALKNSHWKKLIAYWLFEREHLRGARCLRALCVSEMHSIRQFQLNNDIAVIPNGIDLPTGLVPSAPPWNGVVEPGRKVLLFLSRIHPKKGLVNLFRAWSQVQGAGSRPQEWILVIAGWDQGGHEHELKKLATELGLAWTDIREQEKGSTNGEKISKPQTPYSVFFLGPQFNAAKASCYHHCDAFVLPSFSEGLPMVVLEAWANSKPVVMTPECNLPEGFQTGAALQVEATEAGIVAGLNELQHMTDAERVAMGNCGHDLVVERFTWPRITQQLQAVHNWILGGGAKPDCILNA
jgi:poly(glycerol-phosphate) alpha-glucosyltransferase